MAGGAGIDSPKPRPGRLASLLRRWGGFVKFSHTIFALPFALGAMALAARDHHGWPGWKTFLLILTAMATARTCAMAFNRIADRKFDADNPRTADRDLPAGRISLFSAWALCLLSSLGFLAAAWGIDMVRPADHHPGRLICLSLAPVALFFICFYSLTKRFTSYTHFFLGLALALAPVGAWLAVRGDFQLKLDAAEALPILVLAFTVIFWVAGFDIIYALQDYEFDKANDLHSLITAWGPDNAINASLLAHVLMFALLVLFGPVLAGFRLGFLIGLLVILFCLALEHWIARKRGPQWATQAFFRMNAIISMVFLAAVLAEVIFPDFCKSRW